MALNISHNIQMTDNLLLPDGVHINSKQYVISRCPFEYHIRRFPWDLVSNMENWVLYINIIEIWQVVSLWKNLSHLKAMEKLFHSDKL